MNDIIDFALDKWWLIFFVAGPIGGVVHVVGGANARRVERRQERFRLKQQTKIAVADAQGKRRVDAEAETRSMTRLLGEHDEIDARWFAYETDVINLLEYPMMTNMRDPLTVAFHRAMRGVDSLRPDAPADLVGNLDGQNAYRAAVHDYAIAFDAAESEARRRRRGDFSEVEQHRLTRAQGLLRMAMDTASTPQERQAAYRKAREELDGLVSLPTITYAQIERRVAGELEA